MTNKDIENIDVLEELKYSLKNEENEIDVNKNEINTESSTESSTPSFNNEINLDFLNQDEIKTLDISNISNNYIENEVKESEFINEEIVKDEIIEEITTNEEVNKIDKSIILEKNTWDIPLLKNIKEVKNLILKKKNKFTVSIIFITKYVITSSLIFAVLLVSTNYNAYLNIAKNYLFKWDLQATSEKLISSVEASSIKEKYSEEKLIKLKESQKSEKLSIRQMKKEQDKKNIDLNIEITPYENRVVIPKIGKNIPLIEIQNRNIDWEEELNNIFMKELEKGIIRYPGSAKPGEEGSSFIFGHSSNFPWIKWDYNDVFSLLDNVVNNDEIIVYYGQEKYVYKITEKKVITPWDVWVLNRNKKKSEITLMTCWPIWTTLNRLIVTWELVDKKIK